MCVCEGQRLTWGVFCMALYLVRQGTWINWEFVHWASLASVPSKCPCTSLWCQHYRWAAVPFLAFVWMLEIRVSFFTTVQQEALYVLYVPGLPSVCFGSPQLSSPNLTKASLCWRGHCLWHVLNQNCFFGSGKPAFSSLPLTVGKRPHLVLY